MKETYQYPASGFLLRGLAIAAITAFVLTGAIARLAGEATAANPAATLGMWAPMGDLCVPGHPCSNTGGNEVLLPTNNVLFYMFPAPGSNKSASVVFQPKTGTVSDATVPIVIPNGWIFCSGVSVMPNGQVLVTGGYAKNGVENPQGGGNGIYNTTLFNPFAPLTSAWSAGPPMNYARWYPSTVELADGTMLEVAGDDQNENPVATLESYNYKTNTWTVLPASANMPSSTLHPSAYPRLVLLPSGKVFLAAPDANTYQFDPGANTWSFVARNNFGLRYYAPHVLLPGLQQVLVAGGSTTSLATNTAEVIDFSQPTPKWSYTGSMTYARINSNLVLLADGTVLAVGGAGGGGTWVHPVLAAELYNPVTGTWKTMASQATLRMYHSTAILLPDGRVLSAGSNDASSTMYTYEIYYPPYLFAGPRPAITSAPGSVTYGHAFNIVTSAAASIARVALVRPGATTHADNFDQRYVDLSFTAGSGQLTATAPPSGNYAPPGFYMLVIVNSSGVPSVMTYLQLG